VVLLIINHPYPLFDKEGNLLQKTSPSFSRKGLGDDFEI